jgi:hypothetical protein
VGIGIGVPSFLIAVLSAWLVYLSRKRKLQNKSARKSEKTRAVEEMELTTVNTSDLEGVDANQKIEDMLRLEPGMTGEGDV